MIIELFFNIFLALAQACDRIIRIEDGRLYERKKESAEPGRTAGKGGDRS